MLGCLEGPTLAGKEAQAAPKPSPTAGLLQVSQPAPSRDVFSEHLALSTQPYLLLILLLRGSEVLIPLLIHLQQLRGEKDG